MLNDDSDIVEVIKALKDCAKWEINRNLSSYPLEKLLVVKWWRTNFGTSLRIAKEEVEEQIEYYKIPEHIRKWRERI